MSSYASNLSQELIISIKNQEQVLINTIRHRLGIKIHQHQIETLHKIIFDACKKFNCDVSTYLNMLLKDSDDSPALEHLIAGITVGETYFFREKNQMRFLQESLLPQLIKLKRSQNNLSLRIWSAGCASGEEIYTICMMLFELLPDIDAWRLNLLGTDLNTKVLKKAIKGYYSEWSMRAISSYYKTHYFSLEKNQYILSEKIRNLVHFDYLNLNDDTYPSLFNNTNAQDVILCRNVLIYFDSDHISKLMKKLAESLMPGGFLLLGASDPIVLNETDLVFHHKLGLVFSRPTSKEDVIITKKPSHERIDPRNLIEKTAPIKQEIPPTSKLTSIKKEHISIEDLLAKGLWPDAITEINFREKNGEKSSALLNAKATAYANLGKLEDALQSCKESLQLDATNKYTYFTFALTLAELNRLDEAEVAFRKTLFLDHMFAIGHFQLGLLLLRKKQQITGLKSLSNALAITETQNPTEPVPGYAGLYYGRLSEIFKHEIEMYTAKRK